MKALMLALLGFSMRAFAIDEDRLLRAIYVAEGGPRASQPYGITTVKVRSAWQARRICRKVIQRARASWDGRGDFIAHLGRIYCPPSVDPVGHKNWVRNVRVLYAKP